MIFGVCIPHFQTHPSDILKNIKNKNTNILLGCENEVYIPQISVRENDDSPVDLEVPKL